MAQDLRHSEASLGFLRNLVRNGESAVQNPLAERDHLLDSFNICAPDFNNLDAMKYIWRVLDQSLPGLVYPNKYDLACQATP